MTTSPHDRAFARFCRSGEPDDLAVVYDATGDRLLRAAMCLAPSVVAAEDLLQATFVVAIERRADFDCDRPVLPWLLGILTNQARLARWRDGRQPVLERTRVAVPPAPFEEVQAAEFQRALDRTIDGLPDAYRPVLMLRLRHDMPAAEIALVLGRPPGTVRSQLARGMEMVRRALPVSFVGVLAVLIGPTRGLAAVRHSVLSAASHGSSVAVATGGGILMGGVLMKKLMVGLIAIAAIGLGWTMWPDAPLAEHVAEVVTTPAGSLSGSAAPVRQSPAREVVQPPPRGTMARDVAVPRDPERVESRFGSLELSVVWRANGDPAPGVHVMLMRSGRSWEPARVVPTDENGRVFIEKLEAGGIFLRALRGGEGGVEVRAGETTKARLSVPAGVRVTVHVVDGSGTSIEGAGIWLSERWRTNRGGIVGKADHRGRIQLEHVSQDCHLGVRHRGFKPSHLYPIRAANGSELPIRVMLRRGGSVIAGRVVDHLGAPVAGARVLVGEENPGYSHRADDGTWSPGPPPMLRTTDATGRFRAEPVPVARLTVQVRGTGFAPFAGEFEAVSAGPVEHRIVLAAGAVIHGKVTAVDGQPVPFARITAGEPSRFSGRMVFADSLGGFEVRGLPCGPRGGEVTIRASIKKLRAHSVLHLAPGQRLLWNPVLRAAAEDAGQRFLTGRVIDHRGEPLAEWRVAARSMDSGDATRGVRTDLAGRFRLAVPWAEMRVWTHPPLGARGIPPLIRDGVRADDGELVLRIEEASRRSGEIKGVVVDIGGAPVRAQIEFWHVEVKLWRKFDTDPKTGEFRIEGVPPGVVQLKVCASKHPWMKLPRQTVEVGQTIDLGRIEVELAGTIEGRVRLVGGRAPGDIEIRVQELAGSEAAVIRYADGHYRSGGLASGTYRLIVKGDHIASTTKQVRVSSGSATSQNLVLQPAALRVLRFTLPKGVARPRFLSVLLRGPEGRLAWNGGCGPAGLMGVRASVVPGSYRLLAYGPGRTTWLDVPFVVENLADQAEPTVFEVRPSS